MIRIFADGVLVSDSRLEDHTLLNLTVTTGLDKSGTASIVLPSSHPAYDKFISYRTIVEIYRDSVLKFRGRALYLSDDFYNRRTITCEGERGFLRDAVMRPYSLDGSPAEIFAEVMGCYNGQVDAFKRFSVGEVTVQQESQSAPFESGTAEQISDTVEKLISRFGGYIVFGKDGTGGRTVSWLRKVSHASNQVIAFGENLLDLSLSGANAELATVIVPYGARGDDGNRLTIESVNGGADFIEDKEASARYGRIIQTVSWDDVTEPDALLAKAKDYLENSKQILPSIELTALDLSVFELTLDSFCDGDIVRVRSKPHGLDASYQLTDRTENLLNPSESKIILGRKIASLTDADVSAEQKSTSEMRKMAQNTTASIEKSAEQTSRTLSALVAESGNDIRQEASLKYATKSELSEAETKLMQTASETYATKSGVTAEIEAAIAELGLPAVTSEDNGKILGVADGKWALIKNA